MPTRAPRLNNPDIDAFADDLNTFMAAAIPEQIVAAIVRAARLVEEATENGRVLDMSILNNCTQTFCLGAATLSNRLRIAERAPAPAASKETPSAP